MTTSDTATITDVAGKIKRRIKRPPITQARIPLQRVFAKAAIAIAFPAVAIKTDPDFAISKMERVIASISASPVTKLERKSASFPKYF